MPTLDSTSFGFTIAATENNQLDLLKATAALAYNRAGAFSTGVGAGQADRMWSDKRNILASANDDLDLSGTALQDPLGVNLALARVKLLAVYAYATNINTLILDGAAGARITTILGGTTPTLTIRPGGLLLLTAPDATGYAITATTADILRFTNGGAGTAVDYDVVIIGATA